MRALEQRLERVDAELRQSAQFRDRYLPVVDELAIEARLERELRRRGLSRRQRTIAWSIGIVTAASAVANFLVTLTEGQ